MLIRFTKLCSILGVLLVSGLSVCGQSTPLRIGQWRTHLPYTQAFEVANGDTKVYCLSNITFFSYDKGDGYVQRYDKVNGLSGVKVTRVAYNKTYKSLVVAYSDGNIDLIKDNNIINISDIKRKNITGSKDINNIVFRDSLAYLSCSFGIVVLDLIHEQINDSYIIGDEASQINVRGLASDSNYFYAATDEGVKIAPINSPALANYQNWVLQDPSTGLPNFPAKKIESFRNRIIVSLLDSVNQSNDLDISTQYVYNTTTQHWDSLYHTDQWQVNGIDTLTGRLVLVMSNQNYQGRLVEFDSLLSNPQIDSSAYLRLPMQVMQDDDQKIWVADVIAGLNKVENGQAQHIEVNGPSSIEVNRMALSNGVLWVAPTQLETFFDGNGFYKFDNNYWSSYNQYNYNLDTLALSVNTVLTDPNTGKVYFGSLHNGLMVWDNGQVSHFDQYNSILQGSTGNSSRTQVTGLALDANQNLWMGNYGSNYPLVELKNDGTWAHYSSPYTNSLNPTYILIDDYGHIWSVISGGSGGILVYDPEDNLWRLLNSSAGNGGLPSSAVNALARDEDGSVWVGTDAGIAVFYCPGSLFTSSGCDAQQILVSNDGFAGYLLATEKVTAIAVDGGNRKWVGTTNGLWLFSPDGTKQLAYYDEDNSPLLSNNITSIAIDGTTGEVFVGTLNGIISLRAEATDATDEFGENKACVFPNPIKETYNGIIAIKCLAKDGQVKITDTEGRLVYQTYAVGGEATWDGKDYNGNRAHTGVYLVFAVNSDGSKSFVTKLAFIH